MAQILELIASAIESVYTDDDGKPSVLVTKISSTTWFASVGRYPIGMERQLVVSAKGITPDLALIELAREWLKVLVTSQVSALAEHLGLCKLPTENDPDLNQRKISFEEDA